MRFKNQPTEHKKSGKKTTKNSKLYVPRYKVQATHLQNTIKPSTDNSNEETTFFHAHPSIYGNITLQCLKIFQVYVLFWVAWTSSFEYQTNLQGILTPSLTISQKDCVKKFVVN